MAKTAVELCPCGLKASYSACCGRYHAGALVPTPEALMRSRYSAFVKGLEAYLLATWHPATRPASLNLAEDSAVKWLGLTVKRSAQDGDCGWVSFVARYREGSAAAVRLVEHSRFERIDGAWLYRCAEAE